MTTMSGTRRVAATAVPSRCFLSEIQLWAENLQGIGDK
jgi:hypothetical protein